MSEPLNGGHFYEVHGSQAIVKAFRQVQQRAIHEHRGQEMVTALVTLRHRLQRDPLKFGEPLYRLAALRMQVRTAVVGPLVVSFGVCEDRPMVFIKSVSLLSKR